MLALGATMVMGMPVAASAKSRVQAGDFQTPGLVLKTAAEAGPGDWGVFIHGESDAALTLEHDSGRGDSPCVSYEKTDPGSENIHLDQIVEVQQNTIYELTAWVRGDGVLKPVVAISGMDWDVLDQTVCQATHEWQRARLIVDSRQHDQIRIEWFPGAEGTLYSGVAGASWLDDVELKEISSPGTELRNALALTAPRQEKNIDLREVRRQPVGDTLPLRPIHCQKGVLLYADETEVALWGVNFQTALSWEYRARMQRCGLPLDAETLRRVTDANLDEIQQLGMTVVRLHLLPGDFSDEDGHLRQSVFLDALDYLVDQCGKRGIYITMTLVNEMSGSHFTDSFMQGYERAEWITNPDFKTRMGVYVTELLQRRNPYSKVRYQDDPAIAVVEIANEPSYVDYATMVDEPRHAWWRGRFQRWARSVPGDVPPELLYREFRYQEVRNYLNQMCSVIRQAGCPKPIAWSLNWPRMINGHEDVFQAVADSDIDVISFCLYPGQDDVKHPFWKYPKDLSGKNYLPFLQQTATDYQRLGWALGERFAQKAKIVYEFETMYNQTAYLYPGMARVFRALGVQMAHMWTYSLTPTAEYISGSHHLNLYCTPRKAVSFAAAGELFRWVPRYAPYAPDGTDNLLLDTIAFVSFESNLSVVATKEALMHSGTVPEQCPLEIRPKTLRRISACGSSPLVEYEGTGAYFLTLGEEQIDVVINPDAQFLRPLWDKQDGARWEPVCALNRSSQHRFALHLPGWETIQVERTGTDEGQAVPTETDVAAFIATPGRYRITRQRP